jgi:hypothetical protein
MAEIVPNGVNHKILTTKKDCQPSSGDSYKKKSVGTSMGPFVSDKYRVRQNHLSHWVRPGWDAQSKNHLVNY